VSTRLVTVLILIVLIFFQYRLWFEPQGIRDMVHMKKQLSHQLQDNAQLKKRNELLLKQVQQLQNNQVAVESRARNELGMIKKGETYYQVVK